VRRRRFCRSSSGHRWREVDSVNIERRQLHLGSECVALRDIDAKLTAIPAALRIIVADARRTSDVATKGVTTEESFAITVDGSAGTRTVMGELWSSPDRAVAPPGKYVVQRRGGGPSAAVQIDVGRSEPRELSGADFRPVPEEVLARKGGELVLRPNERSLAYGVTTARIAMSLTSSPFATPTSGKEDGRRFPSARSVA
jgi:hypothetical protein